MTGGPLRSAFGRLRPPGPLLCAVIGRPVAFASGVALLVPPRNTQRGRGIVPVARSEAAHCMFRSYWVHVRKLPVASSVLCQYIPSVKVRTLLQLPTRMTSLRKFWQMVWIAVY